MSANFIREAHLGTATSASLLGKCMLVDRPTEKRLFLTGKGAALPENMRFYQKRAEQYPDIYKKAGDMLRHTYRRLSYQKFHYVILRTSGRTAMDSATMLSMY